MSSAPVPSPPDAPPALVAALADRHAHVVHWWREAARTYLHAEAPGGPLFARFSHDEGADAVIAHEVDVRARLGSTDEFRAPAVLVAGPNWMVEDRVVPDPVGGPAWTEAAVRAAVAIARLEVPSMPETAAGERRGWWDRAALFVRTARSPLSVDDLFWAKRAYATSGLPEVSGHGDFHAGNVLVVDGMAWVIDWELAGRQPVGWDLMQLWATLDDPDDAARVFEGAVAWLGEPARLPLARLRYVAAVRAVTAKLFPQREFDADPDGAARLLALLPGLRAEARLMRRRSRTATTPT